MRPTTFYNTAFQGKSLTNDVIFRSTSLEPVDEETEDTSDDAETVKEKGKIRFTKIFKRLRPRKSLHRSVHNSHAPRVSDIREDDSTVAVDNTTGSLSQFLDDERRDRCDDEDSSRFLDDFSVTAFAPDDEQQPLVLQEESEDIWSACKVGDEAFVKGAILYAPETVHRLHDGRTPLYYASLCGHETIVRLLLEAGATDPERTAYLCALNQNIRSLIKRYPTKSISNVAANVTASVGTEKLDITPKSLPVSSPEQQPTASRLTMDDSIKPNQDQVLAQLSSLSASETSSCRSESPSGRSRRSASSSASTPVKVPALQVLRRKISAGKLVKAGLVDPHQYALPDLSEAPPPRPASRVSRTAVVSAPSEDETRDAAADDTLLDILLSTSLIDCREVVLPDILVDGVAVQAVEDDLDDGNSVSNKSTHKLTAEDKLELLQCSHVAVVGGSPNFTSARTPLKAAACGITAVLEEAEEDSGKAKRKGASRDVVADSAVWGANGLDLRERNPRIPVENADPLPSDSATSDDRSAVNGSVDSDDLYVSLIKRENSMKEQPGAWERLQTAICHGCEVLADIFIK